MKARCLSSRTLKRQNSTASLDNLLIFLPLSEGVRKDKVMVRRIHRMVAAEDEENLAHQAENLDESIIPEGLTDFLEDISLSTTSAISEFSDSWEEKICLQPQERDQNMPRDDSKAN